MKKAKAEDETSPQDLSASKLKTQQQDPLGRTRASRAKKPDTTPEEMGPPRAQTEPAKTTRTASKKQGSRKAAEVPSSSSHPHPGAEGDSVGEESSNPAEEAPKTRRGKGNAITTTAAAAVTSSRKRKTPATKPTAEDSSAKRRELAPIEEEAEAQPAETAGAAEIAASDPAAGVDENYTEGSPVKGKGKAREETPATVSTTTGASSKKRKTASSNDIATRAPPPKRRKPSPLEEETGTQAETEIQPTVSTAAAGNTSSNLAGVDRDIPSENSPIKGKGKATTGNPAPEPSTGVAENPTTEESPIEGKGKATAKAPPTTSPQKRKTPPVQASTATTPRRKKHKPAAKTSSETTSSQQPAAGPAAEQAMPSVEATSTEAVGNVAGIGAGTDRAIDIGESQANTSEEQTQTRAGEGENVAAETQARPQRTRTPTPKAAEEEKKKARREKK